MDASDKKLKFKNIAISGKYATGTTTLAKNLIKSLGWKYINAGDIQRQYDREHNINENKQGAIARPDEHERGIEAMTKKCLETESDVIYEAWLAGFIAKDMSDVLKVYLFSSNEGVRIDRVVNRDHLSVDDAKKHIRQREDENIKKWKKLYGDHDFWDEKNFDIVIDTYSSGPMETFGKVLDKLNKA
ncbi:MAG: cytidylate kinase family protein [bacterium]